MANVSLHCINGGRGLDCACIVGIRIERWYFVDLFFFYLFTMYFKKDYLEIYDLCHLTEEIMGVV